MAGSKRGIGRLSGKRPSVGKLHEGSYAENFVPSWDKLPGMGQQINRVKARYAGERQVPIGGKGLVSSRKRRG